MEHHRKNDTVPNFKKKIRIKKKLNKTFSFQTASKQQKNPETNDAYSYTVSSTLIATMFAFFTVRSIAA